MIYVIFEPRYWISLEFPLKSPHGVPVCAMTTSHTTSLKGWRPDICYFWAQLLNSRWIPLEFPLNLPMLIVSLCYNYFTHYVKAWKGWRHDLSCFHAQWASFACSLLTLIGSQAFPAIRWVQSLAFAPLSIEYKWALLLNSPWIPLVFPFTSVALSYTPLANHWSAHLTNSWTNILSAKNSQVLFKLFIPYTRI